MRIVAGKHRGRRLRVPSGATLRPTADRVREAVFNILVHHPDAPDLENAVVVDVFAGTGAYGLEALSRGAALAVFVDRDPAALEGIRANAAALGEHRNVVLLGLDAERVSAPPSTVSAPAALAFLDPPYGSGLAVPALEGLRSRGWIEPGAVCVVETAAREPLVPPAEFGVLNERTHGAARVTILRSE